MLGLVSLYFPSVPILWLLVRVAEGRGAGQGRASALAQGGPWTSGLPSGSKSGLQPPWVGLAHGRTTRCAAILHHNGSQEVETSLGKVKPFPSSAPFVTYITPPIGRRTRSFRTYLWNREMDASPPQNSRHYASVIFFFLLIPTVLGPCVTRGLAAAVPARDIVWFLHFPVSFLTVRRSVTPMDLQPSPEVV